MEVFRIRGTLISPVGTLFHRMKSNGVGRFIILFSWRVYFWKDTDRMIAGSKDTGFCYMVSFPINVFRRCTFRAITYDTKRFKFITIWFYNITVINVDDWFRRNPFFNLLEIRRCSFIRNSFLFCLVRFLFGHFNFTSKRIWIPYILNFFWNLFIWI